jgi:hypothetical protein
LGQVACGVNKCTKCPQALKKQLQDIDQAKREQEMQKRKVQDLDEAAAALLQGPTKKQSTLKVAFGKQDKSKVDALWGRAFYGIGLSFRLINDPHFKAIVEATADFGENYKLPSLVSSGETRFATNFIMLQCMHEVKASLQQLVVSDAWGEWNQKSSHEMEGEEVHDILTSAAFWKGVKELLAGSESIVCLLRQCNKGVPVVGKVYYAMFLIGKELGALKEGTSEQHSGVKLSAVKYEQISWLWRKRWEYLHSNMHSARFVLEPEFQSAEYGQDQNAKVMQGFLNILEKLVPDADDQAKALQQLAQFRNQEGLFGRPGIQAAMRAMLGWKFWQ